MDSQTQEIASLHAQLVHKSDMIEQLEQEIFET